MYKNVLVISDNKHIAKRFLMLTVDLALNVNIQYATSPFSDAGEFSRFLGKAVIIYDLREEKDINDICNRFDLVLSIHCKQMFPLKLLNELKCINVHPGYNPINRGWYPQVFSIIKDLPVGATIHEIDKELDHGPIIDRQFVEKRWDDTSLTLYNRIVDKEFELLKKNLSAIINQNYKTFLPEENENLFLKKDFKELCRIELEEKMTALEFINKTRALTHGEFKNAYFLNPKTNRRIYVKIILEEE